MHWVIHMDYNNAFTIYQTIINGTSEELIDDLLQSAIRYARIRVDWLLADDDGKRAIDDTRTRTHNAFIDSCNILCRAMARSGENTQWRELLGNDRKMIGDFACYIHCIMGIKAR